MERETLREGTVGRVRERGFRLTGKITASIAVALTGMLGVFDQTPPVFKRLRYRFKPSDGEKSDPARVRELRKAAVEKRQRRRQRRRSEVAAGGWASHGRTLR